LKDIQRGFEAVKSFPELKNIPVIIGECDPEGCAACSEKRDAKYGYRNGTMYSSYTAASFARIYELMDRYRVNLRGAVSWSFEFEDQDWFAGFRELATHGIDKPVLNVFRMFSLMSGNRILVKRDQGLNATDIISKGVNEENDINAIATRNKKSVCIMIWNYNDNDIELPSSGVEINVDGLNSGKVLVNHYRVDRQFSNSFEKWKSMGKPQQVTDEQYKQLKTGGQLQSYTTAQWKKTNNGKLILIFNLPSQAVSLIRLTW